MVKNWKRILSELSVSLLEEPTHLIQKKKKTMNGDRTWCSQDTRNVSQI
jgi:hypothetical protein